VGDFLIFLGMGMGLGIPLVLVLLALITGNLLRRNHLKRLVEAEARLAGVVLSSSAGPVPAGEGVASIPVAGEVVLAADFWLMLRAALRSLVGGRVSALEEVLERARREALVRLQAQAAAMDARLVLNLRVETARLGNAMVEVLAYGTAIRGPGRNP